MERKWIKETLDKLSFVKWDRYIDLGNYLEIYGWIDRDDDYKDFVLLEFNLKTKEGYCLATSSSKYSKEISKLLDEEDEHIDCVSVKKL